jgi:hypothetical protein
MRSERLRPAPLARAALTMAGLLWPTLAHGQVAELKPARIEYEYYPSAGVRGGSAGLQNGEARFQSARASFALPTPLGTSSLLIPGVRYQVLDVGSDGAAAQSGTKPIEALHSMQLSLGMLQRLSDDWSLFGQVGGGLAGDLSGELASDDWVVSAQLLTLWALDDGFTLGAGIGYDRRTGQVAPLPLLALRWEPRPDLLLRGVVPQFLSVRYRAAEPLTLALDSGLEGERYHLSEESVALAHGEVAYSVIKLGPSVTFHWTKWLHSRVQGGLALHRRFELYLEDHSQGDLDVGTGPFAGVELWIGPSGWSSDVTELALDATRPGSDER